VTDKLCISLTSSLFNTGQLLQSCVQGDYKYITYFWFTKFWST